MRRGLVDLIDDEPGLSVCGQAGDLATALSVATDQRPDVAIVDLRLGAESGLDLLPALTAVRVRVLVLSAHDERLFADRALHAGALGYIMKDSAAGELIAAIRCVAGGRPYVSAEAAERIFHAMGPGGDGDPIARLSNREREVLTLLGRGLTTREIADALRLSVKTVETHYAHLKEKLGARSGRDLTRIAVTWTDGTT